MKYIIGSSFYNLLQYGNEIELYIKENDMTSIEFRVNTNLKEYVSVLFFQKNFMALSAALFLMMISWLFILFTALQGINTKESPGLYFGLYMAFAMTYGFIYISSVFLLARGITIGLKIIYYTFNFIVVIAVGFSLFYLYSFLYFEETQISNIIFFFLITIPLLLTRLILNTKLIETALVWAINERARKAYLKLMIKNYQSPRKIRKLRVG
ncbi:hypothetical protein [Rahnella ecdela]|uniref:Uncharacterized protein n=1 Tax=Rahnella ecdela TaxID=2816250 RepID=A0ABS6LGC0_9GAMM|nr:hypothetical protein [Rahnella ecdela]MBU9845862.1 hypothetical protein [Rahnella ecdela]